MSILSHSDIESQPEGYPASPPPAKERFNSYSGEFTPVPESPSSFLREKSVSPRGMRPNRRVGESVELGGIDPAKDDPLTEQNLAMHTVTGVPGMRPTRYHHAAHNFTSPLGMCHPFFCCIWDRLGSCVVFAIDIGRRSARGQMSLNNSSRLTFNRRIT